jgi:hypothetical protein
LYSYRCADLDKVFAHRLSVVHGIKSRDFINSHGRHFQQTSNLVHDTDTGKSMLALSEVEKRHDSSLLVLGRVTLEDLIDDFFVLGAELERDGWVVVGFVAVLENN